MANYSHIFQIAGAEGIGPTLEVLETPVLPLYYAPLSAEASAKAWPIIEFPAHYI